MISKEDMDIDDLTSQKKRPWFVYFSAISVNLLSMVTGLAYVWTSPFIPKLNGSVDPDQNPLETPTTLIQDSWIASLVNLGSIFGPIFAGTFCNRIGKKNTLLLASSTCIISNIIMIFANKVAYFYVARFLVGIGIGCVYSITSIYVGEITEISQRGTTSLFMPLSMVFMQFVTFVIGPYITIRTMSYISLVISVSFVISFGLFVPDSPYQLVLNNHPFEAEAALVKFRGSKDVFRELTEIKRAVEDSRVEVSFRDIIKSKPVRKSLGITFGLLFFQQFSGILAIVSYLQTIFDSTAGVISGDKIAMLVGGIQFITMFIVTKLIDYVGRKTLILFSFVGLFISLIVLGGYFYFKINNYNLDHFSWLPMVSACVYILCFNVGIGPVPWTIISEIFPGNLKTYLSSLAVFSMLLEGFVVTLAFPSLSEYIGMDWSLWMFAGFVLCAIVFVVAVVPETKDKTLQEIQEMLI